MSSSNDNAALRQRRRKQILQDQTQQELHSLKTQQQISQGQTQAANMLAKFYMGLMSILAVILIIVLVVFYSKSVFTTTKPIHQPIQRVLSFYPTGQSPRRDLKRFYGSWVYATDENKGLRNAVRHAIELKKSFKKLFLRSGRKFDFMVWEQDDVERFLQKEEREHNCGDDFCDIYNHGAPEFAKQDLIIWCMLSSGANVIGFVNQELQQQGDGPGPQKIMDYMSKQQDDLSKLAAVWKLGTSLAIVSSIQNNCILSDSLLLIDKSSSVPRTVLDWLITEITSNDNIIHEQESYRQGLDRFLYQQIQKEQENGTARWILLNAECQEPASELVDGSPRRPLARHCRSFERGKCCHSIVDPPKLSSNNEQGLLQEQNSEKEESVGNMLRHV